MNWQYEDASWSFPNNPKYVFAPLTCVLNYFKQKAPLVALVKIAGSFPFFFIFLLPFFFIFSVVSSVVPSRDSSTDRAEWVHATGVRWTRSCFSPGSCLMTGDSMPQGL